jgi:4,5-DOPA dioxygenase extradiol
MPTRMPVIFIGHGSPMNAIEDNEFSKSWEVIGKSIPRPKAILCISAHWETAGTKITAMEKPRMIYDFYGFPQELFDKQYPAPGSPDLAQKVINQLDPVVTSDQKWGFDHGCWSVLCRMYPKADIPVVQLSLDHSRDGNLHFEIGKQLQFLREEGVLVLGSGNIVHNLARMVWEDTAFDWASDFDNHVKEWIRTKNYDPLIQFEKQGITANLSINSAEHYLPMLYVLGASDPDEKVTFYNEKVWGGSLSMRCIAIGLSPAG